MGIKTVCAGLAVALSLAAQTPISVQVLNQTNLNAGLPPRPASVFHVYRVSARGMG